MIYDKRVEVPESSTDITAKPDKCHYDREGKANKAFHKEWVFKKFKLVRLKLLKLILSLT